MAIISPSVTPRCSSVPISLACWASRLPRPALSRVIGQWSMLNGNRTKINSPLTCLRSDYHTPLGKSLGALQTGLVPLHLLLAHTPPTLILLLDQLHFRLLPLPCHRPRPTQHCLHTRQQRPVPVPLQDPPTTLDRIVLAVIGRIVHQLDHQTEPVRELHQPLDELRPPTRRLRAVV